MGVKISALPAIVTPALGDVFPVVQAGVTYKESITQLSALIGASNVSSIIGTANQVIASSPIGNVTLSLPQSIATTSNVTFGSVAFSPTTKGIVGTTTNDNAAAGYVGEFISQVNSSGTSVTTATAINLATISLTAGDWDVNGSALFVYGGANGTNTAAGISLTTNTLPAVPLYGQLINTAGDDISTISIPVPYQRMSLAITTSIYLVGLGTFGSSTCTGYGTLTARRVR